MDNKNNFSATLRRLKETYNLTNKQLAVAAGVAEVTIIKYLTGARNPSKAVLQNLAKFFHVPESELFADTENNISAALDNYNNAVKNLEQLKTDISNASIDNMPDYINKLTEASKMVDNAREALQNVLMQSKPVSYVPVYANKIPAGYPNTVGTDDITDWCAVPTDINADFAVNVTGDSMINAGIDSGDIVFATKNNTAEHGDVVIAVSDDGEATIKYFVQKDNQYFLMPANPDYKPIPFTKDFRIVGVVTAILKQPKPYKSAGVK